MKTQLTLVFILISLSFSTILNVDGEEYTTIQSAIDDALTGDTVLVYDNETGYYRIDVVTIWEQKTEGPIFTL